ncbi:MAG TPA: NifU family protein [Acidimicrobiales bacterium]|nr:NifU family protein [Acidimicrobiales bacterium]
MAIDEGAASAVRPLLQVTDAARAFVLAARDGEPGSERLALYLEVNGTADGAYTYDMWFEAEADAGPNDAVHHHDALVVVVPASSVEKVSGATLDVADQGGEPGLVIVNPNTPPASPLTSAPPVADLSSPVALAVVAVLEDVVNPQIAAHGGRADLVAVEAGVAYLRLGGGCQGCGLAQVTLSQGISVAIKDAVPEITDVVDVTSHGAGTNPYFESAKK